MMEIEIIRYGFMGIIRLWFHENNINFNRHEFYKFN